MSFKDLALPLAARGIPVIPVQPFSKETYLPGGEERGTTDPERIAAWDRENPDYNVGCLGTAAGITVLDCDVPGLMTRIEKETGQKFPPTLIGKSAGKGCTHLYFRQTDTSRKLGNAKGDGLFDLRSRNHYVVGPGSALKLVSGDVRKYTIWRDAPIADFPDWLEPWILANSSSKKGAATSEMDEDSYIRLRTAYLQNLNPADMLGLENLTIQSLHPTLHSLACILHDGRRTEDEVGDLLERIASEYGHREARGRAEIDGIVAHAFKKEPCEFALPDVHPEVTSFSDGLVVFATEELLKEHQNRLHAEYQAASKPPRKGGFVTESSTDPIYPIEVWDDTDYGEFAEICARDNYIPREFLVEAIKTVTGAVLGSSLYIPDIEGGLPRFYTVLMGSAGSGKGTSISWASSVFKDISLGGTAITSLLWSPATVIQDIKWTTIGACEEGFNSAPGMQRSNKSGQKRWLQTFEELDHMIEGSGIDGSGKALMGVNRQLYDREDFSTTTTGKRDAIAGKAQNSILSATTPEIWTDMFAGKSVRGSGLFQRFNLIVSDENRKKGSLRKPRLDLFKVNFAAKIMEMDKKPVEVAVSDKVLATMDEWFTQEKFANPEVDGEVRGRLNVLAWRNALHLSWQRRLVEVGMRELQDAFRLSEYQFEMRLRHTPAEGDNPWALVENKIRNFLKVEKKASRRDIVRALNLHRYGGGTTDKALSSLSSTGEIKLFTVENLGPKSTFAVWQD